MNLTNLTDIIQYCDKNGVRMANFMLCDMNGRWRHVTMPVVRITEEMLENGFGFDGSAFGFMPVEKSDMVFLPDLQTCQLDPFAEVPTILITGEVRVRETGENALFSLAPRSVAQMAEEYLKKTGIADSASIAPKMEFHVFDHASFEVGPNKSNFVVDSAQASWNTGRPTENNGYQLPPNGGYRATPPLDALDGFRSRAVLYMEKAGIKVKYHQHGMSGSGQSAVELVYTALSQAADKTMLAKYLVKNLAVSEDRTATFMPKPVYSEAGNGLHLKVRLFKDDSPLFYDENGYSQLSQTALYFMGGVLAHLNTLCAFTCPTTNSYKRLVPGYEAPVMAGYGIANRSTAIRIPGSANQPEEKCFELRCPDGMCNPYYAYAAVLMAGLDGVMNKLDPEEAGFGPYDTNLFLKGSEEKKKRHSLPKSLGEALNALEADNAFLMAGNVFSPQLIDLWVRSKRAEIAWVEGVPQPAEYQLYYDL